MEKCRSTFFFRRKMHGIGTHCIEHAVPCAKAPPSRVFRAFLLAHLDKKHAPLERLTRSHHVRRDSLSKRPVRRFASLGGPRLCPLLAFLLFFPLFPFRLPSQSIRRATASALFPSTHTCILESVEKALIVKKNFRKNREKLKSISM